MAKDIKFDAFISYTGQLAKLKNDFEARWNEKLTSPDTNLDGFETIGILGHGSFGEVRTVKEKRTGEYYACKMLDKDHIVKTKQVAHTFNEKRVLASVYFPFCVRLQFSRKDNDNLYLGLTLINGGELFAYHRKVRKFNEKQARFYAAQVVLAFEYLHYMDLLYRDLKPENILLDRYGYVRVTDFGFTKRVESRTLTLCGTPEYLAPEIIQSKPYGNSVDWWAFGILVYELVAGSSPFSPYNKEVMKMYSKIVACEYKVPGFFSEPLKDLIEHLLRVDVSKRLGSSNGGAKDVKSSDWFKGVDWIALLNRQVDAPYVPNIKGPEDVSQFEKAPERKAPAKSNTNKHADTFQNF